MNAKFSNPMRVRNASYCCSAGTLLGDKVSFLPSGSTPVVVQALTEHQIACIPRGKFSIKVLGPVGEVSIPAAIRKASRIAERGKVGVVVKGVSAVCPAVKVKKLGLGRGIKLVSVSDAPRTQIVGNEILPVKVSAASQTHNVHKRGLKCKVSCNSRRQLSNHLSKGVNLTAGTTPPNDGETLYATIMGIAASIYQIAQQGHEAELRKKENENMGEPDLIPVDSELFPAGIDENKLASCIFKVKQQYFGANKKCMQAGHQFDLAEFCLLMLYVFYKAHIIKTDSQKPFVEYLHSKVFTTPQEPQLKTMNNRSNDKGTSYRFKKFKDEYTKVSFDVSRPVSPHANVLYLAFHEIATAFHNSEYFCYLRKQRKALDECVL